MTTYKIEKTITDNEVLVRNNEDGTISYIPLDPANSDYQAYLKELTESVTNDSKGNK
jgi:hypothetical protein